jgi:hypothetical protein
MNSSFDQLHPMHFDDLIAAGTKKLASTVPDKRSADYKIGGSAAQKSLRKLASSGEGPHLNVKAQKLSPSGYSQAPGIYTEYLVFF